MHSVPKSIAVVMLHGDCDMYCSFCVTEDAMECMSVAQYEGALDRIEEAGFDNIVIGGGEPFCWPGTLRQAAMLAKARGFFVQVGTNGLQMPDDAAHPDCVDRYVLPLDGATPADHDRVRFHPAPSGSHHAVILGRLEQMKRAERSVTVSTVVTRANLDSLVSTGDFLADFVSDGGRLHAWHLYCFIPEGRGGLLSAGALAISGTEFQDAVGVVRGQGYPFTIFKRPNMRHSASVDFFWRQGGRLVRGSEYWTKQPVLPEAEFC